MLTYKGYVGAIELDRQAGILQGRVVGIRDVITFEAERADEIEREFHTSVDEYLAFCAERGQEPEPPFSGKLLLRMEADLHRAIAARAAARGVSINKWIEAALRAAVAAPEDVETERVAVAAS
jgi:predicted HicB family RNase H-like nuclease